jgi:hypothetical protein
MLAMKIVAKSFGNTFAFIIASTRANTIYSADIIFWLRVNIRIPVDFTGGCLKKSGAVMTTIFQRVECADEIRPERTNTILAIFAGRSGAGKIIHPLNCNIWQTVADIATDKVKIGISDCRDQICLGSRFKVVKTPDLMPKLQELVT